MKLHPVILKVIYKFVLLKKLSHLSLEIIIVGLLVKFELSTVLQHVHKLNWDVLAKLLYTNLALFSQDLKIFFITSDVLPREPPLCKVNKRVTETLKVVSSRLFYPSVCVN